jgi:hypothetical protein
MFLMTQTPEQSREGYPRLGVGREAVFHLSLLLN